MPTTPIEVDLTNTAVGPRVLYTDDADESDVDAEVPAGWTVDYSSQVRASDGRWSCPLVRARAVVTFAAIGSDGTRPVVWGVGATAQAALEDAAAQDVGGGGSWDAGGSATVEIAATIASRIEAGEVSCHALGIAVRVRDGSIVGAEATSTTYTITGRPAISVAELLGLTLEKYAGLTSIARTGLTVEEAREVARRDPRLIWIDTAAVAEAIGDDRIYAFRREAITVEDGRQVLLCEVALGLQEGERDEARARCALAIASSHPGFVVASRGGRS